MQSAGDDLISIAVPDPRAAQQFAALLRERPPHVEAVAGIDSVVVRFDNATISRNDIESGIQQALEARTDAPASTHNAVEIPISYGGEDGPDFAALCEQLGLSRDQFIELHSGEYIVDMLGFTPGFAYVGGLDEKLDVARLNTPRVSVAAGSVGIAGGHTGLYALPGPGGWPIVGRTDFKLFDAGAQNPFAIGPGTRVRFVAVQQQ